jgi:YHS domain-containing protein
MKKAKAVMVAAVVAVLILVGLGAASVLMAADPQTKCPVMGWKIDQKVFADHAGKRVFFCCASCQDKFKAEPEKYLEKMEKEGVAPSKAP